MKMRYKIGLGIAAALMYGAALTDLYTPKWLSRYGRENKQLDKEKKALAGQLADIENKWKEAQQNEALSLPDGILTIKPGTVTRQVALNFENFLYNREFIEAVLVDNTGNEYPFKLTNFEGDDQDECINGYMAMMTNAYRIMLKQNAKHFPRTRGQMERKEMQLTPVEVEYFKDEHGVPTGIREIRCDAEDFVKFVPVIGGPDYKPVTQFDKALGIVGRVSLGEISAEDQDSANRWMWQYQNSVTRQQTDAIDKLIEWSRLKRDDALEKTEDIFSTRVNDQGEALSGTPD